MMSLYFDEARPCWLNTTLRILNSIFTLILMVFKLANIHADLTQNGCVSASDFNTIMFRCMEI